MLTLEFPDGKYKIHKLDIPLFANTGIWDILDVRAVENELTINRFYIPRYVTTFAIFMHCLRGYDVDMQYLGRECCNKQFISMLIADNLVYKVHAMTEKITILAYTICPKILTNAQVASVYEKKSTIFKQKSAALVQQIKELDEDAEVNPKLPHRYLQKQIDSLRAVKNFDDFRADVNAKLPAVLIAITKIISDLTHLPISPNFVENIKMRIRNDPELARELYQKLDGMHILHSVNALLSCLSAFVNV